jgi:hypothetical protein
MWLEKLLFTRFRIRPVEVVCTAYAFMILTAITWTVIGSLDVTSILGLWDLLAKLIH